VTILEVCFLVIFWTWVWTGCIFLLNTILPRMPLADTPEAYQIPYETVRFRATDGLWLSGWKLQASPTAPWIILCHGLGTNRADLLGIAAGLVHGGLNVFAFDFRGHGESQGRSTSFGWLEQRDLEGALAFLGSQADVPDRPYGVFGISMGGAAAIMVAAKDERLAAVAVDSPYSDLEQSLGHHLTLMYRLPRVPFLLCVKTAYRFRFGAWPAQMSPQKAIEGISPRPVLVIYGDQDIRMPLADGQALFEAAGHPKELWIIPSTEHLGGFRSNPKAYLRKLLTFFRANLKSA